MKYHNPNQTYILFKSNLFLLSAIEGSFKKKDIIKLESRLKHLFLSNYAPNPQFQDTVINFEPSFLKEFEIKSELPISLLFDSLVYTTPSQILFEINQMLTIIKIIYKIQKLNA
jgi:hypothetical protein